MLNIFKHKSRQSIDKKTSAEIKAIQKDIVWIILCRVVGNAIHGKQIVIRVILEKR